MGVRGFVLACLGVLITAPLLYAQPQPATPSLVERQPWDQQSVTDGLFNVQDAFERIVRETGIAPTPGPVKEIAEPKPAVPATDLGSQLAKSPTVESVSVQQRSPVSFDPHIRGYTGGQIYAASDGVFWSPVRRDLDSMLSKIDPSLVRDVVVTPGPYGLRYGPGFAFIDVSTFPTPRYDCFESHGRLGVDVQTNGGRVFGRATAFGGGPNYGYAVNYGNRVGGDYSPGGIYPRIPASYQNQTVWGQFGFDLSDEYSVEFRYLRLDQTDTEYALQFFDVDYLATDSFSLSLVHDDHCGESWTTTAWHNRTRFDGDTRKEGKRLDFFPVLQRVDAALANADTGPFVVGETFGDYTSTGIRTMKTYGEAGWTQLNLGADFRYLEQHIREDFDAGAQSPTAPLRVDSPDVFYTNQPRSHAIDPGLFAELSVPTTDYWTTRIGARVDYFQTDAKGFGTYDGQRENSNYIDTPLLQSDILYAFYVANDLELTDKWLVTGGFGHAQRVPTLTERYADGLFLGIIQNGFSRVIGDPELNPERAWQVDLGLEAKEENWRGFVRGYYSWIIDYVTYQANIISDPSGARLLGAVNTDLATLTGFEAYGERDLSQRWAVFGSASMVYGQDEEISAPLAQIRPFESTVGLRWRDPSEIRMWGVDFGFRMVARQPRIARFRGVGVVTPDQFFTVPVESVTPGFCTAYLRGYYRVGRNLNVVGGIENLFDRAYLEHLDLRLPADPRNNFVATNLLAPGFSPFVGIEWVR